MIFTQKIYPRPVAEMILDGTKTCTRRLVKEGEDWLEYIKETPKEKQIVGVTSKPNFKKHTLKIKWQVGRDYCVSLGRGKAGLWYCPKCKAILIDKKFIGKEIIGEKCSECGLHENEKRTITAKFKPLRFKITGIRKERLLDLTEADTKKEGFKNKMDFLYAFLKINKLWEENIKCPNPEVWVLDFKVKK